MFGIGPTELAVFLVIVLLAVGPERLPTFMRTVGKGLRQVRNASREFKEAIGLDELMREGDPFRAPPVRPPRARPVPVEKTAPESSASPTTPPPIPEAARESTTSPAISEDADADAASPAEPDSSSEAERS